MSKNSYFALVAGVILIQTVNIFFYYQLGNFHDFENTTYSEKLIQPTGKNEPYRWTANVRLPFAILNLSDWTSHHRLGAVILSGQTMYSIPLTLDLSSALKTGEGNKSPLNFLGGTAIDHKLMERFTTDNKSPEDFLNLRWFIHGIVFWSRVALITVIELSLIVITLSIWGIYSLLRKHKIDRHLKIKKAYQLKDDITSTLVRIKPEFDRAWLIAQNLDTISDSEKELRKQFYYATALVVKDYTYAHILEFYDNARQISLKELDSGVAKFIRRVDDLVSSINFQEQTEKSKKAQLISATFEYQGMGATFRTLFELRGSGEYGKMYVDVQRTLDAIQSELRRDKVHDKRYAHVRKLLPELVQGLKIHKERALAAEKTATPV